MGGEGDKISTDMALCVGAPCMPCRGGGGGHGRDVGLRLSVL